MSADQVAEIAPAIREVLAAGAGVCATFEVSGNADSWVQFTDGTINAAYPSEAEPASVLSSLGGASLQAWEPAKFLTASLAHQDARAIAKWIDRYFEEVLSAPGEYSVDVTLENL